MQKEIALSVAFLCGLVAHSGYAIGQITGGSEALAGRTIAEVGGATVFGGLRLWENQWDIVSLQRIAVIPNPASPTTVVLQDVVVKDLSKTAVVPIPFVGVRAGNFLGFAAYFPRTGYNSQNPLLGTVDRDEFDVTAGYAVAPSLVVSVGYKYAFVSKLSGQVIPSSAKIKGVLIGASGSAPLIGKLSLYGNVAYGFGREKADLAQANGSTSASGNYAIGEVGVSYVIYEAAESRVLKDVSVTFGYRAQNYTSKGVVLGTFTVGPPSILIDTQSKNISSTTNGFVVGIAGSF
jgi:hypothetical protein